MGRAEHGRKHLNYNFRNTTKHYFTLPNEIFCLGLSSGEIAVYSYLLRCENRKTYQCYPSYRTIGKALKMSQNTVRKYVQSLEDKHLISTERTEVITEDGRKRNGTLLYTIRPIREAIDYFHSEQLRRNA
ncbi:MAG: helix-turn-helix domain-containing protein [Lachnospiraceae bacterium]